MSFIIDPFRYATGAPPAFAIAATGSYNSNDVAFNAHNLTLPASISSGIAVSSVVSGSTLTPDPPSLTPSWGSNKNIWFAVDWYGDSNTTFGGLTSDYPANYTLNQLFEKNGGGSTGMLLAIAARMLTAASDDPGVFTHTGAAKGCDAQTIAVKSA